MCPSVTTDVLSSFIHKYSRHEELGFILQMWNHLLLLQHFYWITNVWVDDFTSSTGSHFQTNKIARIIKNVKNHIPHTTTVWLWLILKYGRNNEKHFNVEKIHLNVLQLTLSSSPDKVNQTRPSEWAETLNGLYFYRLSSVLRSAARSSSSGSSSTTCVTGSWCGASHTRGTGRWPTSTLTCWARRTLGPRWAVVVWDLTAILVLV